jgi:hypothetical protein
LTCVHCLWQSIFSFWNHPHITLSSGTYHAHESHSNGTVLQCIGGMCVSAGTSRLQFACHIVSVLTSLQKLCKLPHITEQYTVCINNKEKFNFIFKWQIIWT